MKKNTYRFLSLGLCLLALLFFGEVYGQGKIAYVSEAYILEAMPATKEVRSQLDSYKKQLDKRLEDKYKEFQTKNSEFQQGFEQMSDLERADSQENLRLLQESIIKFERDAQEAMQKKQQELLSPLLNTLQEAIDNVAQSEGYDYIIRADALLYAHPEGDISPLVMKKLNITPPEKIGDQ